MDNEKIDLRICEAGDTLISSHGTKLKYVRPTTDREYLDHVVEYFDPLRGQGTRTHEGFVFQFNRVPETDDDIVKIIKKKK